MTTPETSSTGTAQPSPAQGQAATNSEAGEEAPNTPTESPQAPDIPDEGSFDPSPESESIASPADSHSDMSSRKSNCTDTEYTKTSDDSINLGPYLNQPSQTSSTSYPASTASGDDLNNVGAWADTNPQNRN
ncbi:hypothetical protein MKZ38_001218 [Zalerion maritima]|uniref:Uncharacterized protein n=1 Tax=Zalerion maritima TaxID=339359 RepID=A0AAD5RZ99_9PEZI|nr:hypothetical protein MKZ38_001218 [Zalerion maritima]